MSLVNNWIDEFYLGVIIAMSAFVVWHTKGNADVAVAVLALNGGAIGFYKWKNAKDKE